MAQKCVPSSMERIMVFGHVKLEESSSLTTFHTPFGRYRWCRMPFGMSSAPEGFQRRMHELIEGLSRVEVVANDFVVAGFGDTLEEAFRDHNKKLVAFLQRCSASGVKFAMEKLQPSFKGVPLNGHYATKSGLKIHHEKERVVLETPRPTDVKSLLRFMELFIAWLLDASWRTVAHCQAPTIIQAPRIINLWKLKWNCFYLTLRLLIYNTFN